MMLSVLYFSLCCYVISKHRFFKDEHLPFKFILIFLAFKVVGCLSYYGIYFYYYPGNFENDSTSTLQDAKIIYNALPHHISDFCKMMLGWHSESDLDPLYKPYFEQIQKWQRSDTAGNFFLNDNRMPIRVNAFIMLLSFGNYAVHAIVMVILSFIGQFAFYKTFKIYFPNKEKLLACIIFITPSILFWTSGVLKEPLSVCLLGLFIFSFFEIFIHKQFKFSYGLLLILSSILSIFLKPYILLLVLFAMILFFLVIHFNIKKIILFYIISTIMGYSTFIIVLKYAFNKDVINTIVIRQNDFVSLSKGGIFFVNNHNYLRLEYKDSDKYEFLDSIKNICKIKPHTSLMYWNLHRLRDTIYVKDNLDTSLYKLVAINSPAGSGIDVERLDYSVKSFAKFIPIALFNVACKPFFYDAHSALEVLASLENLCFILFFILCFLFKKSVIKNSNMLCLCLCIVFTSYLLIGLTTTVMGAIVRYKVPFITFLLMASLLCLDVELLKQKIKRYLSE